MENRKIALVAGASRGAGRGIAFELALAGYTVYISARSKNTATTGDSTMSARDHRRATRT